jgi:hypothetical protein
VLPATRPPRANHQQTPRIGHRPPIEGRRGITVRCCNRLAYTPPHRAAELALSIAHKLVFDPEQRPVGAQRIGEYEGVTLVVLWRLQPCGGRGTGPAAPDLWRIPGIPVRRGSPRPRRAGSRSRWQRVRGGKPYFATMHDWHDWPSARIPQEARRFAVPAHALGCHLRVDRLLYLGNSTKQERA